MPPAGWPRAGAQRLKGGVGGGRGCGSRFNRSPWERKRTQGGDAYRVLSAASGDGAACGNAEMSVGNKKQTQSMRPPPCCLTDTVLTKCTQQNGASPPSQPLPALHLNRALLLNRNMDTTSTARGFAPTALCRYAIGIPQSTPIPCGQMTPYKQAAKANCVLFTWGSDSPSWLKGSSWCNNPLKAVRPLQGGQRRPRAGLADGSLVTPRVWLSCWKFLAGARGPAPP